MRSLRRLRPVVATALSLATALAVGACGSTRSGVVAAGDAYADFFAPIEGLPTKAKALQRASLREVFLGPRGWREYEIGRRFELGAGGLPQDRPCAAVWYQASAESPYEEEDWGPGAGVKPLTVTHVGVPFARIGLRRLGPVAAPADGPRCRAAVLAAVDRP